MAPKKGLGFCGRQAGMSKIFENNTYRLSALEEGSNCSLTSLTACVAVLLGPLFVLVLLRVGVELGKLA